MLEYFIVQGPLFRFDSILFAHAAVFLPSYSNQTFYGSLNINMIQFNQFTYTTRESPLWGGFFPSTAPMWEASIASNCDGMQQR